VEYAPASEADHEAVYQTLLHVFHGPDRESFLGALADPSYKPEQRLLARIDGKVASHLHLTDRKVRYGSTVTLSLHGIMWVGTLPEYRGLGFAQNLIRMAAKRSRDTGAHLQALTTSMPQFYKPLGFGVCARACLAVIPSRNLPSGGEQPPPGARSSPLVVRPWRQVELGDLIRLYDAQFGSLTGSILRSEEYWRWVIGRKYAHVIWVACQGEHVHGYAFVKDHRILELAIDPATPDAMTALLSRVRAEALERAYPEVVINIPPGHPALPIVLAGGGRYIDSEVHEGSASMYTAPDPAGLLRAVGPELAARVKAHGELPIELGLQIGDDRLLLHVDRKGAKVDHDRLSRRYLTLSPGAFTRLVMGHSGIDRAIAEDGVEISATTAIDAARTLFPITPIWRSPLDSGTA
jgi:predicted N-acetyltransferase YhbS